MEECKAADYSNILYIRMLWKDLEPEEANMHGFTMNGINGIYKKPKTKA